MFCIDIQLYYFDYLEGKVGPERHEYFNSPKHGDTSKIQTSFSDIRKRGQYRIIRSLTIPSYRCFAIS